MLYLSKGIAEKDSTENLIKVRRGDYTYTVSGNAAKLWLVGRFGFAACDTDEEISDILNLAKMGLAEYETEECQASWYRILTRCVCVPTKKGFAGFLIKSEKTMMRWLNFAGIRLSTAELVFLRENHIQPEKNLLYADNRQTLVETIYTPANIFDNVLEAQMEHASARDTTVETIMSLLRKKKIVML